MPESTPQSIVVCITGGSSGIGQALALEFANHNAKIVFSGQTQSHIEETTQLLKAKNTPSLGIALDAASPTDNQRLIQTALETFGQIDVLIVNAGVAMRAPFEQFDTEDFKKLMDINFMGAVYLTQYALPHVRASKGSILVVSSINGLRSTPYRTAYSASKFALHGFYEALRTELDGSGVHILMVCPGFTQSRIRTRSMGSSKQLQTQSPREETKLMSAEAVAKYTYAAYRKRRRLLVLTFAGKAIVWINTFFPALADRLVLRHMAKEEGVIPPIKTTTMTPPEPIPPLSKDA